MSETAIAEAYVKERVLDQIDWYDARSTHNKRCFRWLRFIEIVLGAAIPFLVLMVEVLNEHPIASLVFRILIAGFGATIAIITSIQGVCKFQEHWMAYRTTCERLKHEMHFYKTGCAHYKKAADKLCLFVCRIEKLISEENTDWLEYIKPTGASENDTQ